MADKPLTVVQVNKKKTACRGCRNDYYNHGDNSTTKHCWSLPGAKMRYRWAINMQTPMDRRDRFRKVRVYECFHGEGPHRDVYVKQFPSHLGGDWADKREQRESELASTASSQTM